MPWNLFQLNLTIVTLEWSRSIFFCAALMKAFLTRDTQHKPWSNIFRGTRGKAKEAALRHASAKIALVRKFFKILGWFTGQKVGPTIRCDVWFQTFLDELICYWRRWDRICGASWAIDSWFSLESSLFDTLGENGAKTSLENCRLWADIQFLEVLAGFFFFLSSRLICSTAKINRSSFFKASFSSSWKLERAWKKAQAESMLQFQPIKRVDRNGQTGQK